MHVPSGDIFVLTEANDQPADSSWHYLSLHLGTSPNATTAASSPTNTSKGPKSAILTCSLPYAQITCGYIKTGNFFFQSELKDELL